MKSPSMLKPLASMLMWLMDSLTNTWFQLAYGASLQELMSNATQSIQDLVDEREALKKQIEKHSSERTLLANQVASAKNQLAMKDRNEIRLRDEIDIHLEEKHSIEDSIYGMIKHLPENFIVDLIQKKRPDLVEKGVVVKFSRHAYPKDSGWYIAVPHHNKVEPMCLWFNPAEKQKWFQGSMTNKTPYPHPIQAWAAVPRRNVIAKHTWFVRTNPTESPAEKDD